MELANAHPKKRFFIEMFTRDIPLLDCVLDLIDNCVDGLARTGQLKMHTISNEIFGGKTHKASTTKPYIQVNFDKHSFSIKDNCGGIDYEYALDDVFNFGHSTARIGDEYLGVYGIGMKRALFKMGEHFEIESHTLENGFRCELDVAKWMAKDAEMTDWTIPLEEKAAVKSSLKAGTEIRVTNLKEEVAHKLLSPQFEDELCRVISRVYAFLVDTHVRISVNGVRLRPNNIPIGEPKRGKASFEEFDDGDVKVRVLATLASQANGSPKKENSGWYVVCNGRLILVADTSTLTGWGTKSMPLWVPKYTSFIGIVFFESKNALDLPWTTTKRGVNVDSKVYRKAITRMAVLSRPILSFCNNKYPSDEDQEPAEREIAKEIQPTTIAHLAKSQGTAFQVEAKTKLLEVKKTSMKVQFNAKISEVEKIRKHLRKPRLGAGKIGEHSFDYYLRQEGLK